MKNKVDNINLIWSIAAVLLCLTLFTTHLLSGFYARYATTMTGGDSARVAAFVFNINDKENTKVIDLTGIQKPGDKETYTFEVANYNGTTDGVCEVALEYAITITELGTLPIKVTFSKIDGANNKTTCSSNETGTLKAGTKESVTYQIDVEWPRTEDDEKYASGNGIAVLQIDIVSQQID